MIRVYALILLVGLGMLIVFVASRLSSDAIGVILGVIFGFMAGLPSALLVYTDNRRREMYGRDYQEGYEAGKRNALAAQQKSEITRKPVYMFPEDGWLADSLDMQAQVQLGVAPRQITVRRIHRATRDSQ